MSTGGHLSFIDNVILMAVAEYGFLPDTVLARQLGCPRTYLISCFARLLERGYLERQGEEYRLTDLGKTARLPLETLAEAQPSENKKDFDWTDLYIPSPGWVKQ